MYQSCRRHPAGMKFNLESFVRKSIHYVYGRVWKPCLDAAYELFEFLLANSSVWICVIEVLWFILRSIINPRINVKMYYLEGVRTLSCVAIERMNKYKQFLIHRMNRWSIEIVLTFFVINTSKFWRTMKLSFFEVWKYEMETGFPVGTFWKNCWYHEMHVKSKKRHRVWMIRLKYAYEIRMLFV